MYLEGDHVAVGNDRVSNIDAATAGGGAILVTSARTGGIGISVTGSTELDARSSTLAPNTGGSVTLQTNGANILINTSQILASGAGSQVLLTTANPAQSGQINLTDATLSADVLKIQALGTNGTLTIGGSQNALGGNTQLLLYAGNGSGRGSLIEFVANTTLNSDGGTTLAAYTVKIDNGVQVSVTGPGVTLYATPLQFSGNGGDGSTTGSFAGATVVKAGNYSDPGTPVPASSAKSPASTGAHRPRSTGKTGQTRPVTLPFEAVQPYLVRGGPALPARLHAPAVTRKIRRLPSPASGHARAPEIEKIFGPTPSAN